MELQARSYQHGHQRLYLRFCSDWLGGIMFHSAGSKMRGPPQVTPENKIAARC